MIGGEELTREELHWGNDFIGVEDIRLGLWGEGMEAVEGFDYRKQFGPGVGFLTCHIEDEIAEGVGKDFATGAQGFKNGIQRGVLIIKLNIETTRVEEVNQTNICQGCDDQNDCFEHYVAVVV